MQEDLKYWNAINLNTRIGPVRYKKLYNHFDTMEEVWQADSLKLLECGLKEKEINYFLAKRKSIDVDGEFEKLIRENINLITIKDKKYPKLLKEIFTPPPVLYLRGNIDTNPSIGVVGTRKFSPYGKQAVENIVRELALSNITIVSGLALGIDALAHQETIKNNGQTYAILGSGVNQNSIHPSNNRMIAEKILEKGGAIISEYPYGTPPLKQNFPARNRIISGLTLATLVIEAPKESGALITANFALEQNRDVFTVPGNIFSKNSEGTNNLIKKGAATVTKASDILEELNLKEIIKKEIKEKITPETPEEEKIISSLSEDPIHIDKIAAITGFDIKKVSSTLTIMEIKGMVKNMGNMQYILVYK